MEEDDYYSEELEDKAIENLEEILESAEYDDSTGELLLSGPWGTNGEIIDERFQNIEDVRAFLGSFGYMEDGNYLIFKPEGSVNSASSYDVDMLLDTYNINAVFDKSNLPNNESRIFTFRDYSKENIISGVRIELAAANAELIRYLSKHPKSLYHLEPRKFEEIVAEILKDLGYDIIITPRTRDGGCDIRAIRKDSLGTFLYLIECKRYNEHHPVGVEIVRSLYGTTTAERATHGIIATTSYFSKDAIEYASKLQYQLSLRDYSDLLSWLKNYGKRKY